MQWFHREDRLDIRLESDESMSQVIDAILFASYELAKPTLLGGRYYRKDQSLCVGQLREQTRRHPRSYDGLIAEMMYVNGRQCRTVLFVKGDDHLQLDLIQYSTFRDDLNEMLVLAQTFSKSHAGPHPQSCFEEKRDLIGSALA